MTVNGFRAMSRPSVVFLSVVVAVAACSTAPLDETPTTVDTTASSQPSAPASTAAGPTPRSTTTTTSTPSTTTTSLDPLQGLALEEVAAGLEQPVLVTAPPGDDRLFVVERRGVIRVIGEDRPFLDIDARVNSEDGIEPGLLGLAFHPEYASNGRFFVFYYQSDAERTRLAEYRVSDDPNRADPGSEVELMGFDKPTNRHNGGMLQFGPDGMLWISTGEGGAASTHAQNPETRLSAILRIDVDDTGDLPWLAPVDNPFGDGAGGDPAVWAWGLRNPWRFWIDAPDSLIYIGDVGHETWEEIDVVEITGGGGFNFGWLRMEGTHCFQSGCDAESEGLTLPVYEYSHDEGCSITGGVVYRGSSIPEVAGRYFFADWCGGWVRSLRFHDGVADDVRTDFEGVGQVNGFGVDGSGELYVLTWEGTVSKIVGLR